MVLILLTPTTEAVIHDREYLNIHRRLVMDEYLSEATRCALEQQRVELVLQHHFKESPECFVACGSDLLPVVYVRAISGTVVLVEVQGVLKRVPIEALRDKSGSAFTFTKYFSFCTPPPEGGSGEQEFELV